MYKIIIAAIFVLNSCGLFADGDPWSGYALAVGKPTLIEFHSLIDPSGNEIYSDSWFKVEFEELEVIHGDLPEQDKYTFLILAHGPNKDEMYLLLDVSGKLPKVLNWTRPLPVVCFPRGFLNESIIAESFTTDWGPRSGMCTLVN